MNDEINEDTVTWCVLDCSFQQVVFTWLDLLSRPWILMYELCNAKQYKHASFAHIIMSILKFSIM